MRRKLPFVLLAATTATVLLAGARQRPAEACGAFFARGEVPAERRPSLSVERVLIVHDPETQVEHFIREIVFRGSRETFGFVVPTPTRPEVFKVTEAPFNRLETEFPFEPPAQAEGAKGTRSATGGAPPGGAPKVMILDVKKVGSFTAFVLAATDSGALAKWLKDNGLSSTPQNDEWLKGYVERKFFYVAFRYEPTKEGKDDGQPKAETVRITFQTPLAYYPYREPQHPSTSRARNVGLWVASPEQLAPVSLAMEGGQPVWVKPFMEGWTQEKTPADRLKSALGPEEDKLLTASTYTVQPFEDQKVSREGFGDVVFLPKKGVPAPRRAAAAAMLELLRPASAKVAR